MGSDATTQLKMNPELRENVVEVSQWLQTRVLGQERLIDRLLIALLIGGHLLVEGVPGLAKTRAIKELANAVEGDFHRIQFTPDLLPSDITGSEVFRPEDATFTFQQGPIFHNLLLADEINRAPAKVQSALLEAMGEHQVSVGRHTFQLPELFLVMATQNPIEQEGTYPLPEAQLDRFLMHVNVDYPAAADEHRILALVRGEFMHRELPEPPAVLKQDTIFALRHEILGLYTSPAVEEYMVQLVVATRESSRYGGELEHWIEYGASPRGTIALDQCSRAHAWLRGSDFVTPEDVQAIAHDALRHRIIVSFEAEAAGIHPDRIIDELMERVPAP